MNEDIYSLIVKDGIAAIYREYAEGKFDREDAREALTEFLISKGEIDAHMTTAVTVNQWSR
jgi:hypothetical protein